ncbi:MAG TPA: ATP-binding protein [Bacillota bacterium]|nr:ATP-binding protein [Bacillota bacterium]
MTGRFFKHEYTSALTHELTVIGQGLKFQLDRLLAIEIPLEELIGFEEQCREIIDKYPHVSFAAVVNPQGKILFHSNPTFHRTVLPNLALRKALDCKHDRIVQFTENRQRYYGSIIAITNSMNEFIGAIILALPESVITSKTATSISNSVTISLAFLTLSFALITLALAKWVTSPLSKLDQATKMIIDRGPESFTHIMLRSTDEIGRLAQSFNKMADELQKTTVSKTYMNNIISSMNDALFVTDLNLTIITVNRAACELLQYREEELLQQSLYLIFNPSESIPMESDEHSLLNAETSVITKQGLKIPVLLNCSFIKESNGKIKSLVVTIKDITERKKAEEALIAKTQKLARSNAALQELTYAASHDLQEPLRKIIAFNERILTRLGPIADEQSRDYLYRVQNATQRMQALINDLLSYSRITSQVQFFQKIDLSLIAEEVLNDLQFRIEQSGAHIELGPLPEIEADPTQIRQLFQNLIGNAIKYHREGVLPHVKISANIIPHRTGHYHWQANSECCELIFEDNGIGIDPKYFQRIFGVFQRLHGRDQYEGTGVGLAICQKIVERHNGTITVESTVGEGSKFIVILPVHQPKEWDDDVSSHQPINLPIP